MQFHPEPLWVICTIHDGTDIGVVAAGRRDLGDEVFVGDEFAVVEAREWAKSINATSKGGVPCRVFVLDGTAEETF